MRRHEQKIDPGPWAQTQHCYLAKSATVIPARLWSRSVSNLLSNTRITERVLRPELEQRIQAHLRNTCRSIAARTAEKSQIRDILCLERRKANAPPPHTKNNTTRDTERQARRRAKSKRVRRANARPAQENMPENRNKTAENTDHQFKGNGRNDAPLFVRETTL